MNREKDIFIKTEKLCFAYDEEDENGDISVYDYKTDRVSQEEMINSELLQKKMIERHSKQLSYYNEAIKRLFSRECKHLAVYSTCAAKEIEIPQN